MPIRRKRESAPEHWSRDFVEHLRTVHFALLTVCGGLLLLLASKPYDARVAASQMANVIQVSNSLSKDQSSISLFQFEFSLGAKTESLISYSPWFVGTLRKEGELPSSNRCTFHIVEPNLFACQLDKSFIKNYYQAGIGWAPKTMHDFEWLWNHSLAGPGVAFDSIVAISPTGRVRNRDGDEVGRIDIASVSSERSSNPKSIDLALSGSCEDDPKKPIALKGVNGQYEFTFTVVSISRIIVNQRMLEDRFHNLKTGDFDTAIADLAKAVRGREEVDFGTLAPEIYGEATRGSEAFEAFGIKFPSEQVTGWGMIVLISIQLYFVMYLRRFSNLIKLNDPGREMPWVAMDGWWLARLLFFVSVVALPLCAASFVLLRFTAQLVPGGLRWSLVKIFATIGSEVKAAMMLMIAGYCLSATLSIVCWKYRPKFPPTVEAPEVLEDQGSGI